MLYSCSSKLITRIFTAIKCFSSLLTSSKLHTNIFNQVPSPIISWGDFTSISRETIFYWVFFQGIFISTCNVDVRWFPFDIQRCELKFGSWTFDGWLLDLQMKEADVSGYMRNGEWDLLGKRSCGYSVAYQLYLHCCHTVF